MATANNQASTAAPNTAEPPAFPRELRFYTALFSKDIEITAPNQPNAAVYTMHAEVSNWATFEVVVHQGPSTAGPAIAGAKFHRKRAELASGDPYSRGARWLDMHNENSFGTPRFVLTIPGDTGPQTFRWERTRDGDDGVPGKHYRMKDTKNGRVVALYVVDGGRKGRLIYRDAVSRDQALLILISFISVIVKGRRSRAGAAGAAGAISATAGAGGGGA